MATRFYNVLAFPAVAAGGSASLAHGLNENGNEIVPAFYARRGVASDQFVITVDAINVTVLNLGPLVATIDVLVWALHSFIRNYPNGDSLPLTGTPFEIGGGGVAPGSGGREINFISDCGAVPDSTTLAARTANRNAWDTAMGLVAATGRGLLIPSGRYAADVLPGGGAAFDIPLGLALQTRCESGVSFHIGPDIQPAVGDFVGFLIREGVNWIETGFGFFLEGAVTPHPTPFAAGIFALGRGLARLRHVTAGGNRALVSQEGWRAAFWAAPDALGTFTWDLDSCAGTGWAVGLLQDTNAPGGYAFLRRSTFSCVDLGAFQVLGQGHAIYLTDGVSFNLEDVCAPDTRGYGLHIFTTTGGAARFRQFADLVIGGGVLTGSQHGILCGAAPVPVHGANYTMIATSGYTETAIRARGGGIRCRNFRAFGRFNGGAVTNSTGENGPIDIDGFEVVDGVFPDDSLVPVVNLDFGEPASDWSFRIGQLRSSSLVATVNVRAVGQRTVIEEVEFPDPGVAGAHILAAAGTMVTRRNRYSGARDIRFESLTGTVVGEVEKNSYLGTGRLTGIVGGGGGARLDGEDDRYIGNTGPSIGTGVTGALVSRYRQAADQASVADLPLDWNFNVFPVTGTTDIENFVVPGVGTPALVWGGRFAVTIRDTVTGVAFLATGNIIPRSTAKRIGVQSVLFICDPDGGGAGVPRFIEV